MFSQRHSVAVSGVE